MSSKVKVTMLKNVNFGLFDCMTCVDCADPFCYEILGYVMSRCDIMTSRRDILTSFNDIKARILTRRAHRGRARQRSGVFIGFGFRNPANLGLGILPDVASIFFCCFFTFFTKRTSVK